MIMSLAAFLLLASTAEAIVLGVGPATLEYRGTTRGGYYVKYLTASTVDEGPLLCRVSVSGEAAEWMRFENDSFTLEEGRQVRFPVRLTVPPALPNGLYTGTIELTSVPSTGDVGTTGVNVGAAVYVKVLVEVTGDEGAWFRVLRVTPHNAVKGQTILSDIVVKNNADTPITPAITLRVVSQDRERVYSVVSSTPEPVAPQTRETITVEVPSTRMEPDVYLMQFHVESEGNEVWDSTEVFYITPSEEETFNVQGILEDAVMSKNNVSLGEPVTVAAYFRNTGDLPLDSRLRVDFVKDGALVSSLEGSSQYVGVGEEKTMSITYKPSESGRYSVRIWVEYSGLRTAVREADVIVWTYSRPLFNLDLNFYVIAVPVLLTIVAWIALYYRKYYVPGD